MNIMTETIYKLEAMALLDPTELRGIPEEKKKIASEILQKFVQKLKKKQFGIEQNLMVAWKIAGNLGALALFFEDIMFFDDIEFQINSIVGPKKIGKKVTYKGQIYQEFQDFKKKIERAVFSDGSYKTNLKTDYKNFCQKVENFQKSRQQAKTYEAGEQSINNSQDNNQDAYNESDIVRENKEYENLKKTKQFELFLSKMSRRLENLSQKDINESHVDELSKMISDIDQKSKNVDFCRDSINEVKENVNDLLQNAQEKDFEKKCENENLNSESDFEKNVQQASHKVDVFSGTKYQDFMNILLSNQGFHYSLSSTKNPISKNSKGDGSFAAKIARPLFYRIEELFMDGTLNPEDLSWSEIIEKISETSIMKDEVVYFMNVIKNFENRGDFIAIMSDFLAAIGKFADTHYYSHDSRENLLSIQLRMCEILKNF